MIIVNHLLQFYLLICMRSLQSVFVIISKTLTSLVRSVIPFVLRSFRVETSPVYYCVACLIGFYMQQAFTEKFRRSSNRFLQVAQYLLLLILIVYLYFVLFMRLCLSAQKCAHLMGKILLGVGSSEIGMPTNIVPITLQLDMIGFSPLGIISFLKVSVNPNQYRGTLGTFSNRNYNH